MKKTSAKDGKKSRRPRLVLLGTGLRGASMMDRMTGKRGFVLAGLCDRYPTRMEAAARLFGFPDVPRYTDWERCLDEADPDAVINCTPDGMHAETTLPALARGKFVFLEKPLEITEAKCRAIVDADRRAGGRVYVGFNLRHAPLYRKVKALIDAGVLGRVLSIQADEFYSGGRTYFRRWNRLRRVGGGLWITKASHDFDLLQWLAGARPVAVSAFAHLTKYRPDPAYAQHCPDCGIRDTCPDAYRPEGMDERARELIESAVRDGMPRPDLCLYNSDKDTFDHGVALVDFEGECTATYTVNVVAGFTNRRLRVSGTAATVDGDLAAGTLSITHIHPRKTETVPVNASLEGHGGADDRLIPDFLSFVAGRSRPAVTPEEAMVAVRMGLAATKSSDTGRTVRL